MSEDDDLAKHGDFEMDDHLNEIEEMEEIGRAHGIPWPLVKASRDHFEYAVGLRDGSVFQFSECSFDKDYVFVTLNIIHRHSIQTSVRFGSFTSDEMNFARGVVVRIADVLWAADAPFGS